MRATRSSKISDDEWRYICDCLAAAFQAFDRDHPEVFWLEGSSMAYLYGVGRTVGGKTTYEYTMYFVLKDYSTKGFDVRSKNYQNASAIKQAIHTRDQHVDTIGKSISSDDPIDQIIGYNDWLTKHNAYNSSNPLGSAPASAWECVSALAGSVGSQGPVCEGYARAFKVLCDRAGIPCVLVDGLAYAAPGGEHMWNYVEVEGQWYAVDVTWNDPVSSQAGSGPISGFEGEDWLLLGSETMVEGAAGGECTFLDFHPVANNPGAMSFPNGPELCVDRYPLAIPNVTFTSSSESVVYTGRPAQITPPSVTITKENGDEEEVGSPTISYSYRPAGVSGYTAGLPVHAGTYTVRAHVEASKKDGYRGAASSNTLALTISKASRTIPAPTVAGCTDSTVTLNPAVPSAGAGDGTVEYACSADGTLPGSGWQKSLAFTGLRRNTAYTFFARVTGGKNYENATSSGASGKTDKTRLPKPELERATYAYTGGTVTVELKGFDGSIMAVTGNTGSGKGDYRALVTLSSGDYVCDDGSSGAVELDWKIMEGRTLPALKVQEGSVTETGAVLEGISPEPSESASDGRLEYGCAKGNDIGQVENWQPGPAFTGLESGTTYYFFARMTGGAVYVDVVCGPVSATTKKVRLKKPKLSDSGIYVYEGKVMQAAVQGYDADTMDMDGNKATDAGNYTVTVRLKDTKGYEWEDGTAGSVSLSWKIAKKPVAVKAADKSKYYGEENPALALEDLPEGLLAGPDQMEDLKVTLSTTAGKNSAPGAYPITGVAAADGNYEVTVEPGTLTIHRRPSGGGSSGGGGGSSGGGSRAPGGPSNYDTMAGSWQEGEAGWKFLKEDGSYASSTWGRINNKWYYFDANSNMVTGWYVVNGQWYYMNPAAGDGQGAMVTGWHFDPVYQTWFYLVSEGSMATGWQLVGDKWYYLNPTADGTQGAMAANTYIDGYYVGADGAWVP